MRRIALVLALSACGTDPGAGTGTTTTGGGQAGQGGTGSGASGGGGGGGEGGVLVHPGVLVDEGLVARYYLDEADSGQTPTEAIDAAPSPLPLPISYANDPVTSEVYMQYTEDADGHRGLNYTTIGRFDVVGIDVDGTKISQMIHGGTTMTYEVVAEILEVIEESSRLIHIGFDNDHTLSFEASNTYHLQVEVNSNGANTAPVYWPVLGRAVLHAVLDTSHAQPEDRARIYVNGALRPTVETSDALMQNMPIDLSTGRTFVIGNRLIGERTIRGTIYYGAIYNVALTAEQVAQNAALLLVDDDTP